MDFIFVFFVFIVCKICVYFWWVCFWGREKNLFIRLEFGNGIGLFWDFYSGFRRGDGKVFLDFVIYYYFYWCFWEGCLCDDMFNRGLRDL